MNGGRLGWWIGLGLLLSSCGQRSVAASGQAQALPPDTLLVEVSGSRVQISGQDVPTDKKSLRYAFTDQSRGKRELRAYLQPNAEEPTMVRVVNALSAARAPLATVEVGEVRISPTTGSTRRSADR